MTVMPTPSADLAQALATLRDRWGAAAPLGGAGHRGSVTPPLDGMTQRAGSPAGTVVIGALATAPLPIEPPEPIRVDEGRIVRTGFPALDAILGPGGLPRTASVAVRGEHSSGKTTLALRLAAEAQAGGAIVAWLDLGHTFDPVEAVTRGVRLEWLVVLAPASLDEGLAMAGALLQGRAVDLLLVDLPSERQRNARGTEGPGRPDSGGASPRPATVSPRSATVSSPSARPPSLAERLHRLAALARRAGCLLVVLEPPGLPSSLSGALGESIGLRLELARRSWIRLGRDVVGQRTEVLVARNRFGPPGRRAELRILYAEGGSRDACLADPALLWEPSAGYSPATGRSPVSGSTPRRSGIGPGHSGPGALQAQPPPMAPRPIADAPALRTARTHHDATAPPPLATSPAPARPTSLGGSGLHALPVRSGRPGRSALDRGDGPRHEPVRPLDGHPPRESAGQRTSPRAGGGLPRP
jgi:RecA/RadA recombinase